MASPDFMARVYLKLTWVKVTGSDALILTSLATRSTSLEVHTEVLQSRDDAAQWILCDYYFVEPKAMLVDDTLPVGLEPLKCETFHRKHPTVEASACSSGHWLSKEDFVGPMQDALYYAVFFDIAPQHLLAFEHGLITEAQAIEELEPKTARFHLWQSCMELSRWVVLEAFREAAGREEHSSMPHYLKVRAQLEEWQRSPRTHDSGYSLIMS